MQGRGDLIVRNTALKLVGIFRNGNAKSKNAFFFFVPNLNFSQTLIFDNTPNNIPTVSE